MSENWKENFRTLSKCASKVFYFPRAFLDCFTIKNYFCFQTFWTKFLNFLSLLSLLIVLNIFHHLSEIIHWHLVVEHDFQYSTTFTHHLVRIHQFQAQWLQYINQVPQSLIFLKNILSNIECLIGWLFPT